MFLPRLSTLFLSTYNEISRDTPTIRDTLRPHITFYQNWTRTHSTDLTTGQFHYLMLILNFSPRSLVNRLVRWLQWPGRAHTVHRNKRDSGTQVLDVVHKAQTHKALNVAIHWCWKEFDWVGRTFLKKTLQHKGIGVQMLAWIRALYFSHLAQVR